MEVTAHLASMAVALKAPRLTLGSWGRIFAIVFPLAGLAIGFVLLGLGREREGRRVLLLAAVVALVDFVMLIQFDFT